MSKIDDLRGKLAEKKGKSADTVLRASSAENPFFSASFRSEEHTSELQSP